MSKTDWNALYDDYQKALESNASLSMAEFARNEGLNVNSARRSLNKIKKEREGDQLESDRSRKSSDRSQKPKKAAKPEATKGRGAKGRKTRPSDQASQSKIKNNEEHDHLNGLTYPSRDSMGLRTRNLRFRGATHGAYLDVSKVDLDIREAAGLMNESGGIVQLMSARYLQMYRNQQEALEKLAQDYADDKPWKDDFGNAMPMSQAQSRILFGASKPLTDIETAIAKLHQKQQQIELEQIKLSLVEKESHPLSKQEQMELTEELITYKEENELSGVASAYMFERKGLPIPSVVMAEANKEISMREPEKPELPEITAEELDALMDEFADKNEEWETSFMEERLAAIEALDNQEGEDFVEVIE